MGADPVQDPAALLAAVVQSCDDAIISERLDGTITSWNPAAERLYGYRADEAIGRSIALIVPPERADELREILARVARGERVDHHETERVRKDGTRVPVSVTVSPVRDRSGRIAGASVIARDVSERRQLEAQRHQAARLEGALLVARTAAHELNNAVAPVVGFAELLEAHPLVRGEPRLAAYSRMIAQAAAQVAEKVGRLQGIVRLETVPTDRGLGEDRPVLDLERSAGPGDDRPQA